MVTVDDLKGELSPYQYQMLTQNDDSVAERAIEKAKVWIEAKFAKCGQEVNWELSFVQEALLKRALYELYSYAEQEEKARNKVFSFPLRICFGESSGAGAPILSFLQGVKGLTNSRKFSPFYLLLGNWSGSGGDG